jgi:DNA-binding GntR family transcriptional regulator
MVDDVRSTIGALHLPLRDQVQHALRHAIVNGDYPPGARLTEDRLASDFGVSRNPVREALRVVEAEGFVVVLPRRGAVVASPTSSSIADMFAVRARLEPLAARQAAQRATADEVAELHVMLDAARKATDANDFPQISELNSALHLRVIEISDNRWLASMATALYMHVQWVFRLGVAERAPHSWIEHIALVQAIESGDADEAEAAALAHVSAASVAAQENVRSGYAGPSTAQRPHA